MVGWRRWMIRLRDDLWFVYLFVWIEKGPYRVMAGFFSKIREGEMENSGNSFLGNVCICTGDKFWIYKKNCALWFTNDMKSCWKFGLLCGK